MSRKMNLINVFRECKAQWENAQNEIREIYTGNKYSEEYQEEATKEVLKKFQPVIQTYHDRAIEMIDSGMNALAERWRKNGIGRLTDGGYQAGLSNVIKMLEMGAISEKTDVENIVAMYSEDANAMAAIRKILIGCDNRVLLDCVHKIPEDHREKNKELLKQLKTNVNTYMNADLVYTIVDNWKFNYGLSGVLISIDGMEQFVMDRLDDNLELLS